ncbi:TonB-dependent receptor [Pseudogemmatithrix spongiicola]|uniref:TonB-dependent receptor n=1 Tax=Pseudogemmatithrix spongiicola TaxID=3062599 RepID=A0AA49Q9G0_9BACT|nr:TonB-dependent receptor [Gemmatimonadaceae bacterium 'strain 138']WKW16245.1 TonB-dependent receptor [Gemmatimonadaceae bacterium 'strain 318']
MPRALHLATALTLVAGTLGAQVAPDSAARRDSIAALQALQVRAAYTPRVVGSAASATIMPDSLPLAAAAPSMGEMLRRLPFLYVRQNSRGENELSIRGSESRQAAVLFEGVPLTLTWDARADVSAIPLAGVQQLHYVRGLSSLLSGPNAIGGVVSATLWTDHDGERAPARLARAELQADQFGGTRSTATFGRALRHSATSSLQYRFGAGLRDLPGLARPHGVTEPGRDEPLRLNTDTRAIDAFAGLRYEHEQGRYLSGFATITDGERGVAPELHIDTPRLWRNPDVRRVIGGLSAGTGALRNGLGIGDAEVSLGLNDGRTLIHSYADRSYASVTGTELGEDRTATLRVTFDQQVGQRLVVRGAFTESWVRYLETINAAPALEYRQRLSSAATELDFRPSAALTLSAGVSQDAATTDEAGGRPPLGRKDGVGWRAGGTWVLAEQGLRVHASASQRKRFPALRELYSGALDRFEPNPALRPETAHSAEVGAGFIRARFDVQTVVFRQQIDNAVVRITLPSARFQRVNRDRFTSSGVELTAGTMLGRAALRGDVTLQQARIADATVFDPDLRRPEDVPEVFGSLQAVMPVGRGVEAQARMRALGATRCTNPDSNRPERQGGARAVDLGIERRWGSAARIFGRITAALQLENAFDAAIYDKCGLPQAGRTLRLSVRLG